MVDEHRSSNPMTIVQGLRAAAQCVYLAAPEEVAKDLSERFLSAANELDRLTAIVERDKTSATHRLHNLCDALSEDAAESPFSREAWELADQAAAETGNENLRLKAEIERLRAALVDVGEQATAGVFTEHGDCPATYACSAIIAELISLGLPPKGVRPAVETTGVRCSEGNCEVNKRG